MTPPADVMNPSASLLIRLGSIAVHADELTSPKGHPVDAQALRALLEDQEVRAWIKAATKLGLLPVKR